jgi:hypothetical protein
MRLLLLRLPRMPLPLPPLPLPLPPLRLPLPPLRLPLPLVRLPLPLVRLPLPLVRLPLPLVRLPLLLVRLPLPLLLPPLPRPLRLLFVRLPPLQPRRSPRSQTRSSRALLLARWITHLSPRRPLRPPCCTKHFRTFRKSYLTRFAATSMSGCVCSLTPRAMSLANSWKIRVQAGISPALRAMPPENGSSLLQTLKAPECGCCASSSLAAAPP